MNTADSNAKMIDVPSEDAAIPVALENLDRMISAWALEVRKAQRSPEPTASSSSCADSAIGGEEATVEQPQASPDLPVAKPATEAVVPQHADCHVETIDHAETIDTPLDTPMSMPDQREAALDADAVLEAKAAASAEEDEALLKTLDADTVRAIRIRRRLCNNSKSVRELLKEVS